MLYCSPLIIRLAQTSPSLLTADLLVLFSPPESPLHADLFVKRARALAQTAGPRKKNTRFEFEFGLCSETSAIRTNSPSRNSFGASRPREERRGDDKLKQVAAFEHVDYRVECRGYLSNWSIYSRRCRDSARPRPFRFSTPPPPPVFPRRRCETARTSPTHRRCLSSARAELSVLLTSERQCKPARDHDRFIHRSTLRARDQPTWREAAPGWIEALILHGRVFNIAPSHSSDILFFLFFCYVIIVHLVYRVT